MAWSPPDPTTATASWGSWMELLAASQENDILVLNCADNNDIISNLLISEEDEDDVFATLARAAMPPAPATSSAGDESDTPVNSPPSPVLLDVCKRAVAWLDVPWPEIKNIKTYFAAASRPCAEGSARVGQL